jgi:L-asparagine oxygenase
MHCPSILEFNKKEIEMLIDLSNKITINPSEDPNGFCKQAKELSLFVPERITKILYEFALHGCENGFLLIKTFPFNDKTLGNTPENNNCKIGEKTLLARIQSLLINVMGEMIAYEAEGYGRLFQDVVPIKNMENVQTSVGSNTELEIHTEQAFSKLRPDILSLACLRGDETAYTYILPVKRITDNLNNEENKILYKPLWKTGVDLSFKLNGHEFIEGDVRGPLSILNGSCSDPFLVFDQDLMFGINDDSDKMIKKIVDIYYHQRIKHNLQPGEIIFVDNNRAVHGRSPFFPKYDGNDRFLIRCFATFYYEKSEYARHDNGRTIAAIYS